MKITNHHELRRDVSIDCSSPILTDQSYAKACDINVIMANYAKTGLLPNFPEKQPIFIDNTTIPNLMEAFNISNKAIEMFFDLPADVRKLMDNDPANLELFISNPENADILAKNGLIVKKLAQVPDQTITGGDGHGKDNSSTSQTA